MRAICASAARLLKHFHLMSMPNFPYAMSLLAVRAVAPYHVASVQFDIVTVAPPALYAMSAVRCCFAGAHQAMPLPLMTRRVQECHQVGQYACLLIITIIGFIMRHVLSPPPRPVIFSIFSPSPSPSLRRLYDDVNARRAREPPDIVGTVRSRAAQRRRKTRRVEYYV